MVQVPDWKRPVVALTDAAQLRQSQARDAVSGLVEQARVRVVQLPRAVLDETRKRLGGFELATKHDLEIESRLARNRMSFLLKEFLEAQRGHDTELRESLRTELREELQSFASAVEDGVFTSDGAAPPAAASSSRRPPTRDYLDDDDGDLDDLGELEDLAEIDEVSLDEYEGLRLDDDNAFDGNY